MNRILCSAGAFIGRGNNYDYTLLKEYDSKLDCDGYEVMMYSAWYPILDEVISAVKSYNLCIPVIHAQKSLGETMCGMTSSSFEGVFQDSMMTAEEDEETFKEGTERFLLNLKLAEGLGAQKMVLHLWNGIASDRNIEKNVERFGIWKALADKAGVDLLVENVICNKRDPLHNVSLVAKAYKDAGFVYDTKMAEFHDQTMKIFDEEYEWILREGRIRHLHVNDYGGGFMDWGHMQVLPIGAGHVDFETFFDKLGKYGYTGDFTIEATAVSRTGEVDFNMLNDCFSKLRVLRERL